MQSCFTQWEKLEYLVMFVSFLAEYSFYKVVMTNKA